MLVKAFKTNDAKKTMKESFYLYFRTKIAQARILEPRRKNFAGGDDAWDLAV